MSRTKNNHGGFTLVELVVTMMVMGILAAYVAAKLNFASYDAAGDAETLKASIRLAQKLAIAQRAAVTVNFNPAGIQVPGETTYAWHNGVSVVAAPAGTSITFDGLGRPSIVSLTAITVSGGGIHRLICVEPETGYVHEEIAACA